MKNAVIYTRNASSDEQAINAQLEICREYAVAHDYTVIGEFSDNGYSGMNFNRPAFVAMNNERDKWTTLIVYGIDKLTRNRSDFYKYVKTLRDEGKEIISMTESTDNMFSILESLQKRYGAYKKGVHRE